MSAVVAVVLAVAIPQQVERHLINGEIRSLTRIAGELADQGMIPPHADDPEATAALDEAVRGSLIGSDIVRVKIWLSDGTIAYSDEPDLIGKSFPLSDSVKEVFNGRPHVEFVDVSNPENVYERGLPPLREFYIPASGDDGSVVIFGAYHLAEPIETTVGNIRRYVWLSIAIGIGLLAIFTVILFVRNGRFVVRQRQETEQLLTRLVHAQELERKRVVGALHDDIGQPLYRVHYGIEDCRARVVADSPVDVELARVGALVGEVEQRLRGALRAMSDDPDAELNLSEAIAGLAETTEMETDLSVIFEVDGPPALLPRHRASLFRAAREAVTNARKHAHATSVSLKLFARDGTVVLEVRDDGIGFSGSPGLGLTAARDRLETDGGGLEITGQPGKGTTLLAWMPDVKVGRRSR
jgi:signal transduction histidine kinase